MTDYMLRMLRMAFARCTCGIAFNVMSKHVDWERDDLFHVPFDEMAASWLGKIYRATTCFGRITGSMNTQPTFTSSPNRSDTDMRTLVEFRVPISPTPFFFRRVHFLAASLRRLGGRLADHEIVVPVGGDVEPYNLYAAQPWSTRYPLIWRWVSREAFRRDGYWETSHDVFRQFGRARFVICSDADTIFVRDFSELLDELEKSPAVAGVIGHTTPFKRQPEGITPKMKWDSFFEGYGVAPPPMHHEHIGWGQLSTNPDERYTAPYFNFGFIVAPFAMMNSISAEMFAADEYARKYQGGNKRFQLAFSLCIQKQALPVQILAFRYNFVNMPIFDDRYREELEHVRVIHYAIKDVINRDNNFETLDGVRALIERRDLTGSNETLRVLLEELYPIVAEEEAV